jgi:hypothetical protein
LVDFFGPSDSRIVVFYVAPAHDVVMFPVLFHEDGCNWEAPWLCTFFPCCIHCCFIGGLADHNAQWSLDISAVVKYCVHLSGLVRLGVHLGGLVRSRVHLSRLVHSPMNLHISPTDMNVSITTRMLHLLYICNRCQWIKSDEWFVNFHS